MARRLRLSELLGTLQSGGTRLVQAQLKLLEREEVRLDNLSRKRVLTDPSAFLQDRKMYLDFVQQKLAGAARMTLDGDERRFARLTAKLDAMSPLKVLTRGYSMARNGRGEVIRSVSQVEPGERIGISLSDGQLFATVMDKKENG